MKTEAIAASYRDPSGFVFRRDGVLLRQVNASFREHFDHFISSGLYDRLVAERLLVAHRDVDLASAATPDAYRVIAPDPVPFISYPYEWSFSQLKDAARVTLRVMREALQHGLILRDGTAYNIQFVGGQPVFIDTLSFGRHEPGTPWQGYRQFCEHFIAPLALMARRDPALGVLHRMSGDGIPLALASRLLDTTSYFRLGLLLHLHMHARMQRKYAGRRIESRRKMPIESLRRLVDHLEMTVDSLDWQPDRTVWAQYEKEHNYTDRGFEAKRRIVGEMLQRIRPRTVWDLGANTGIFSRMAAEQGAFVVSMDFDHGAVELNYRRLRSDESARPKVLPLVMDLLNPSADGGFGSAERTSLVGRGPADAAIALALVHHLTLSGNVPFGRLAEFLARASEALIIEFVPLEDPQAQRLIASRLEGFHQYDRAHFEDAFRQRFRIEESQTVADSNRVLYRMTRLGT